MYGVASNIKSDQSAEHLPLLGLSLLLDLLEYFAQTI